MKLILVTSHRRSGTHFLIDSLRLNINNAVFPNHRYLPSDFNLGSLFSKDEKILKTFQELIKKYPTVIIKSHLLPEECNMENPKDKFEAFIKEIYITAKKIYIKRDGKDTLVSLYKFLNPSISFTKFIREKNDHIVKEIRSEKKIDSNRVQYWSYHINEWESISNVKKVSFANLKSQFEPTVCDIIEFLNDPIPDPILKPKIPKNKLWHGIRKKLNHYGLAPLPINSSVRPNKGFEKLGIKYFHDEDDLNYFNKNIINKEID
tara:strand:- start:2326 stop:3111 length:786 start_codon:yes stop_codon:yes gene_type:complete